MTYIILPIYSFPLPELNIESFLQVKQVTFNKMDELQNGNNKNLEDYLDYPLIRMDVL